jgi:hypothetical protein
MQTPDNIEMPAPTAWPLMLAVGLTLISAGMVTAASLSILGAMLTVAGAVGWFRQVLPVESHEVTHVVPEEHTIQTSRGTVERIAGVRQIPRAWLPLETYPITAGVKGGLAGGAAMAVLAAVYGLVSGNGIWYPMNLLVAGLLPPAAGDSATQIGTFHLQQFLVAVPLHLMISLLVGLLYGVMLPIAPKRPILLGGLVTPLLWSFLIHGSLGIINPVMNQRINWLWFVLSQIGFGVAAGFVVVRQERIRIRQPQPLALRMGIEAPGLMRDRHEDNRGDPGR